MACTCLLIAACSGAAQAQMAPPTWKSLSVEQRSFLMEAFNLSPELRAGFSDAVPDDFKQGMLNSLWSVLTPEKRVQVALYAHLEKPWGAESESTGRVLAPEWSKLSKIQHAHIYEAAHWDGNQRGLWETMPAELRQAAFAALWSYMDPKDRQRVLAP